MDWTDEKKNQGSILNVWRSAGNKKKRFREYDAEECFFLLKMER